MTQPLRPYQLRAVETTLASSARRVLNVAPTGAGKTRLAVEYVSRRTGDHSLFIVHRRELLTQAADRLRATLGRLQVGIIAPGFDSEPCALVQVATVQTLLARDERPPAGLIIVDEAHHFSADVSWTALLDAYPAARIIGLTATPQRQDGSPLGDTFDEMVVVAQYSELIEAGFLVPCRVFQPPAHQGSDLALDPLTAYQRYGEGGQGFGFAPSVTLAHQWAAQLTTAGISSAAVDGKQPKRDRDAALAGLRAGSLRMLWNYNVLTEGVDVPAARVLLNARPLAHVGAYLQACGRVLRADDGKQDAIIIDLTGATLKHGFPTEDRAYSLDGHGIQRSTAPCLRNCLQCGMTLHAAVMQCPRCGYRFIRRDPRVPHIFSMELKEVYSGANTPQDAKSREYARLRNLGREKGWSPSWVVREYHKLFGSANPLVITDASAEEKRSELARLRERQQAAGYKPGWVSFRFKATFGHFPPRGTT